MNDIFKARYGRGDDGLLDALLKVHDAVPNAGKRPWALLAKVAADMVADANDARLDLLAAALVDAARRRLDEMISAVQESDQLITFDQARNAVFETDVGNTLRDLLENAERAAIEASEVSKRLDESLAKRDAERRLFDRAKDIQVSKARSGRPISLIDAIEIAKAEA